MIEIIKKHPPKKKFKLVKKYKNIKIVKKISTKIIDDFFKEFPEEKRGRKSFKSKELEIMKLIAYNDLLIKCSVANCDCIGDTKEVFKNEKLEVTASFFKKI